MADKQQPILILPEGASRMMGRNAQRINILAAKAVSEVVRTTLGPRGMDKMLVDNLGDVVITNDGVTILDTMEIEHPAAKMIVEVAKAQEDEVGDGTTTATVLAGELLKKAEDLLDQGIHSAIIAHGYKLASEKAMKIADEVSSEVRIDDKSQLIKISQTSMNGRGTESGVHHLAKLCVEGIHKIKKKNGEGRYTVDVKDIKIEKKAGGSLEDSSLIDGIVLDKERVHDGMPKKVENAKIALLNVALEVKSPETDTQIQITDPAQLESFLKNEEDTIKKMVDAIKDAGANVVFVQKGIDDLAQHMLSREGIFAVRRVKKSDMAVLAKATGGKIITSIKDLRPEDLGRAGLVEERTTADENMIFIEECREPQAITLLIRGGTDHVTDEAERTVNDALKVLSVAIRDGSLVAGGGAAEIEISNRLAKYARQIGGREQLAIEAFAKALEIIPRSLAENAGLNAIDLLVQLKAEHERGNHKMGLDVIDGKVKDMFAKGVVEPTKVKRQAIKSASEAAIMILKIDDVIAASKLSDSGPGAGGMPSGMGGMGGMGM